MKEIINEINSKLKSNKWSDNTLAFLLILVVLSFIYAPVFKGYYLLSDDYIFFLDAKPSLRAFIGTGRPLDWCIKLLFYKIPLNVEDLNIFRFISIVGFSLFALVIYIILKRLKVTHFHALLISILIILLPSFQESIYFTTLWHIGFIYALVAMSGGMLIREFENQANYNMKRHLLPVCLVIIIIIISALFHQISISIFWFIGLLYLISKNKISYKVKLNNYILYFFVGISALLFYFIVFRLMLILVDVPAHKRTLFPGLSLEYIYGKVEYIFLIIQRNLLLYWVDNNLVIYIISAFIGLGILLPFSFRKGRFSLSVHNFFIYIGLILLFILLSILPLLVANTKILAFRIFAGISPIILILFIDGVVKFINIIKSTQLSNYLTSLFLASFLIFCGHKVNKNIYDYVVLPQTIEFRYMLSELRKADLSKISRIHVIQPKLHYSIANRKTIQSSTMGIASSGRDWVPERMIKRGLDEIGYDTNKVITLSKGRESIINDKNTLVIDMRNINYFREGSGKSKTNLKFRWYSFEKVKVVKNENIKIVDGFTLKMKDQYLNKVVRYANKKNSTIEIHSKDSQLKSIIFEVNTSINGQEIKYIYNDSLLYKQVLIEDSVSQLKLPIYLKPGNNDLLLEYKYIPNTKNKYPVIFTSIDLK